MLFSGPRLWTAKAPAVPVVRRFTAHPLLVCTRHLLKSDRHPTQPLGQGRTSHDAETLRVAILRCQFLSWSFLFCPWSAGSTCGGSAFSRQSGESSRIKRLPNGLPAFLVPWQRKKKRKPTAGPFACWPCCARGPPVDFRWKTFTRTTMPRLAAVRDIQQRQTALREHASCCNRCSTSRKARKRDSGVFDLLYQAHGQSDRCSLRAFCDIMYWRGTHLAPPSGKMSLWLAASRTELNNR